MYASRAEITVEDLGPTKLMNRLAKHWAHKFDVELGDSHAVIPLPGANCRMQAEGPQLTATLEADDPEALDRIEAVVAEHLVRMARGEALVISWNRLPHQPTA